MPRNKFWAKIVAFTVIVLIIGMSSISITGKTIVKMSNTSIKESSRPPFKDPPNEIWNKTYRGYGAASETEFEEEGFKIETRRCIHQ